MENLVADQLTASATIVFLMQMLKKSRWFPWLNEQTKRANRIVAVLLSGATAIGIHYHYDPTTHALTITGLCLMCLVHGSWDWLRSFAAQEVVYQVVSNKSSVLVASVPQGIAGQRSPSTGPAGQPQTPQK